MPGPPNYGNIPAPPSGGKKGKKPARPPGPVSASYAASRIFQGAGSAWRGYWAMMETQAKKLLGNKEWALWVLADLVTENPNAKNAQQSILSVAKAMSTGLSKYGGDVDQWYRATHTGYTGAGPSGVIQQAIGKLPTPLPPPLGTSGGRTLSPKSQIYNGWATIKNGKLTPGDPTQPPPKDAVKFNGMPITVAQFNSMWKQINNIYIAYTGKSGNATQIANILNHGINLTYTLPKQLMQTAAFRKSPYWQSHVDAYTAAWQSIYGANAKPDMRAVQNAMSRFVSTSEFVVELRQRKDYVNSEEFKSNSAELQKEYEAIYGKADANGTALIKQATLAGWTGDQFAQYLRKQPGYTRSPEYQSRLVSFLGGLGLVLGGEPTLNPAQPLTAPLTGGAPPPDARVGAPSAGPEPVGPLAGLSPGAGGLAPPTPFGGP